MSTNCEEMVGVRTAGAREQVVRGRIDRIEVEDVPIAGGGQAMLNPDPTGSQHRLSGGCSGALGVFVRLEEPDRGMFSGDDILCEHHLFDLFL